MEHTPQRADISHPHDRYGEKVEEGQDTYFVWAGEELEGKVESVETDEHGVHHAHVRTTVKVPARALAVRKKTERHTEAEKPADPNVPRPPAEHKTSEKRETHPAPHTTHAEREKGSK